jgi:riboflavin kinase/FMN adenylyltransferase
MGTLKAALFTPKERELTRLFLGIPKIVSLRFDEELARLSPPLFWEYLRGSVQLDGVVVGRDFRFGYRRTGDVELLEGYCRQAGLPFLAVDVLGRAEGKISSSTIRANVEVGHCELAARDLGYPYFLWGEVVHGLGRGRVLGFPTANLRVAPRKLLPADGVYAVAALVSGEWRAGALSIGKNPTFDDVPDTRVELFVLDYEGDLYEADIPVFFLSHLRPQIRFEDTEQLVLQINADVRRARSTFVRRFKAGGDWYAQVLAASAQMRATGGLLL